MAPEGSEASGSRKRLLIVDDTRQNISILAEALKGDYELAFALDGEKALEAVRKAPPDLILLDVMMPNVDGYEVCARLKADPALQAIPIIFLTAVDEVASKTRCFSLGAVDYVTKPFETLEVKARVRTHLSIEGFRRDLEAANRQLEAWKARVESEIRAAQRVQRQILPGGLPVLPGYELEAFFEPCVETAGDYYQFFERPGGGTVVALFDVSGKGLGAAMIALSIHTYLSLQAALEPDLAALMEGLNRFLLGITSSGSFATGVLMGLRPDGGLSYVSAGHTAMIHAGAGRTDRLARTGPGLGIARCVRRFDEREVEVAPGDLVCIYSDGFDETFAPDGKQMFGLDRLQAAIEEARGRSPAEVLAHINERIREFQGDAATHDDRTMVLLRSRNEGR